MEFRNKSNSAPIDWQSLKKEILGKLDVAAEYRAMGLRLCSETPNAKGLIVCRAMGREDNHPSAFINVKTGVYHDSGGESLNLWDFTLRYVPSFGRHIDVVRFYAMRTGVELGGFLFSSGGRILEAEYTYQDEHGNDLFVVTRYRLPTGKKEFSQRPANGIASSGCMDGVRLVPYRLPEVAKAKLGESIWIVEGEKDVDRLVKEGLVATCNPMGAGKWRDSFNAWFPGYHVVVIPDNDIAGFQHAESICKSLKDVAASVRIIHLSDLPPHGDVSDWLDMGGTVEELRLLAHDAPLCPQEPSGATENGHPEKRPAHLGDLRKTLVGVRWLWDFWIPAGRICGVAGSEGCGKTRFMLDLARRVWHGLSWPDGHEPTFPKGTPTLWICADGNQDDLAEAVGAMGIPDEAIVFNTVPDDVYGGTDLDDYEVRESMEGFILETNPAFVVIDSLTYATRRDLCRQNEIQVIMAPLRDLAHKHQITIIPQLHLAKDGQAMGRRIRGITRSLIHIEQPDPEGAPDRRRIWVEKSFGRKPPALGVTMGDAGNEYDSEPAETTGSGKNRGGRPSTERDKARQFILDSLTRQNDQRTYSMVQKYMEDGGSDKTFWRARDAMVADGLIVCDGRPQVIHLVDVTVDNATYF